ncbi:MULTISPECIES: hypothetical protein [unclassified Solwaraspora]|uniref:hypothetical protein n=1 Tax=unclassified Solwaraspora TaxID=2627926 RepID=UPI00259B82B1|nr:hypothetical protein [Solwaraspora sp. WMMA2056]WJK40815.1 hypothetical protein O7608_31355 [Solwaraspora sp. WMMA2056]
MTVSSARGGVTDAPIGLRLRFEGAVYPAEEIARGAAYRLTSADPAPGFRPDDRGRWFRFVHACEVGQVPGGPAAAASGGAADVTGGGALAEGADRVEATPDSPLMVPLTKAASWHDLHQLSQTPAGDGDPAITAVRRTATVRRGTRMMKVLSGRQAAGYLRGWSPAGFCYREYDIAHLRTPADLALLRTDDGAGRDNLDVAYALRWRAIGAADYEVPVGPAYQGLVAMPPRDRIGPPVLGTGFTPSEHHLIPEFVTAGCTDLPLPANATLLAYTPDGTEVVLYTYQPEQRGWIRMAGPQRRHLLDGIPDVPSDQEYLRTGDLPQSTQLVGTYQGQPYEAVADPPREFRVLAMTRAARYPVESLARRLRFTTWRDARCQVLRQESGWSRLRLCRPTPEAVAALGAQCHERGLYEVWAPTVEITDESPTDLPYEW